MLLTAGAARATTTVPPTGGEPAPVVVTDAGAEGNRVDLTAGRDVGDRAMQTSTILLELEGAGQEATSEAESTSAVEIVDVAPDGSFSMRSEITGSRTLSGPAGPDLAGIVVLSEHAPSGALISGQIEDPSAVPSEVQPMVQSLVEGIQGGAVVPAEPVGEGATWTSVTTVTSSGLEMEMTAEATLTSLTETEAVIDLVLSSTIDDDVMGQHLTGTVNGEGTVTMQLDNPLDMDSETTSEIVLEQGGTELTMDQHITITSE